MDLQKSKSFKMLDRMPADQLNRLGEFLDSSYFNTRPQVRKMYRLLRKTLTTINEGGEVAKTDVYNELFNKDLVQVEYGEPHDKHLRKVLSDVSRMTEHFLIIEEFAKQKASHRIFLAKALHNLEISELHDQCVRKFQIEFPFESSGSQGLLFHYLIEDEAYKFGQAFKLREKIETLPGHSLDHFYVLDKLKLSCERRVAKVVLELPYEVSFEDQVMQMARSESFSNSPIIQFYLRIIEFFDDKDEKDLSTIREMLKSGVSIIERDELLLMYNYLQNYCIRNINEGDNLREELMRIYVDRIDLNTVLYPLDLQNMVSIAIQIGKIDQAEGVFETGLKKVPDQHKQNASNFNRGHLHFAKKEFKEARKYFQRVDFEDSYYEVNVRVLDIKAWWQEGDEDFALTKVTNFLRFMKRNQAFPADRRKKYIAIFRIAERMIKARKSPKRLEKIKSEVGALEDGPNKKYLMQKLNEYLSEN